jgi:5-hydroxyisourate hydrolase
VISTHVLDTERGRPAEGVRVEVYRGDDLLAAKETGADGRIAELAQIPEPGAYRIVFIPASSPFFRRIELEVVIDDAGHWHIPLLLSSYGCATYRGS